MSNANLERLTYRRKRPSSSQHQDRTALQQVFKTTQNITGATDRASVVMFPYVGPRMTRCRLRGYRRTQMLEVNKARDKMEGGLQEAQAVSPHVLPAVKL